MMHTRCAVCDNVRQCWIIEGEERCAECTVYISAGVRGQIIRAGRVQIEVRS